NIGMAHTRTQAEELEPQRLHLVEVARAAAGDVADAAELAVDRRRDFPELGAQPRWVVDVLADRDLRARLGRDIPQVIGQQVWLPFSGRRRGRRGLAGDRVADDHPQLRQQATDEMGQVTGVPGTYVEQLDGVRDRRGVVSSKQFKLLGAKVGCGHRRSLRDWEASLPVRGVWDALK